MDVLIDPDITYFWNGHEPVIRVLFIALAGYVTLLALLRLSGQRTLAQMTAMDLVITVTLGSAFGRVITAREVALVEVLAAFGALVLLQWLVAQFWGRARRLRRSVAVWPTLVFYDGEPIREALARHRLLEDDLYTAARQQGMGSLEDVQAVIFEANGAFTVLSKSQYGDGSAVDSLR
jgi:uncharacterized membrane protein YcaP (DUF421 family)